MPEHQLKRTFGPNTLSSNCRFIPSNTMTKAPVKIRFVLLQHFSLMAFTAAVDTLVTANLVQSSPLFEYLTLGVDSNHTVSDLGMKVFHKKSLKELNDRYYEDIDILIVCGGYRCDLQQNPIISEALRIADRKSVTLGGIWNGSVAIAHAGLLDAQPCSAHPDNHAFIANNSPKFA